MKKQKLIVVLSALCAMTVTSCGKKTAYDSLKYSTEQINVYREKNKVDKTIPIRFYENMTHIPYIGVKQYYKEFFATDLSVNIDDTIYSFTKGDALLSFDAKEDVLTIKSIDTFSNNPEFRTSTSKMFVHSLGEDDTKGQAKVIRLADYGINVFGDKKDKDSYVPLSLLSHLSGGVQGYNIAYNGKDIYVLDMMGNLFLEGHDPDYYGTEYYSQIDKLDADRGQDVAEYNYHELCLVFDQLRGYTSQLYFGDNNLLSLGLDGLLETYYPIIKEKLLSTKKDDYYTGLYALFAGLWDGGHTGITSTDDNVSLTTQFNKMAQIDEIKYMALDFLTALLAKSSIRSNFTNYRKNVFSLDDETESTFYYRYDDTTKLAYIGFNSFVVDYDAWDAFYKGNKTPEEAPVTSDSYAFVRSKFYQAQADGARYVVLDLTTNGGGNSHALNGIAALVNGAKTDFVINNTVHRNRHTDHYGIDINLDGEFDDDDIAAANAFTFDVAVMTSEYSFSCGNLLPSVMKEYGSKIVGVQSGGGSCAVSFETTSDGILYQRSNYLCLSNNKGENIDGGVPVDLEIEMLNPSLEFEPTGFYDFSTIQAYLAS